MEAYAAHLHGTHLDSNAQKHIIGMSGDPQGRT